MTSNDIKTLYTQYSTHPNLIYQKKKKRADFTDGTSINIKKDLPRLQGTFMFPLCPQAL